MNTLLIAILCLVCGFSLGVFTAALCCVSRRGDDQ